jgi:prepilin-type N-terminal cleavage/methylation domain-containing protein
MVVLRKKALKGFSLIEVIVAALIFALGSQILFTMLYSAQLFSRQAEHKSRVMNTALLKLEESLAKSYSQLIANSSGNLENVGWQVNITAKQPLDPPFKLAVPYKLIEVSAAYAPGGKSDPAQDWKVKVENIVPSPFLRSLSAGISPDEAKNVVVPFALESDPQRYKSIGPGLKLAFRAETPQDLMIIYNIATKTNDANGILSDHTIYTGCFIDGSGPVPVETRTPIISQPLVNNVVAITGLAANTEHTIEIKWFKETETSDAGKVTLREADLMVIAFEKIKK